MKKLVKKLSIVAFIMAIGAAFAFSTPASDELATAWFEVDAQGNIGQSLASSPNCAGSTQYCAVSFDDADLDQDGRPPIDNVTEDPEHEYIQSLEMKN